CTALQSEPFRLPADSQSRAPPHFQSTAATAAAAACTSSHLLQSPLLSSGAPQTALFRSTESALSTRAPRRRESPDARPPAASSAKNPLEARTYPARGSDRCSSAR